jgi:hypothetical protein
MARADPLADVRFLQTTTRFRLIVQDGGID